MPRRNVRTGIDEQGGGTGSLVVEHGGNAPRRVPRHPKASEADNALHQIAGDRIGQNEFRGNGDQTPQHSRRPNGKERLFGAQRDEHSAGRYIEPRRGQTISYGPNHKKRHRPH